MGAATKAVKSWIHQETGIVVQSSIKSFFASGYQLAVLFAKLGFQVSPSEFSKFDGDVSVNHNFQLLKPVLLSLRMEFNDHTLERVKKKEDGAALWLLHQIMKECKRREFKRKDGETVSDDAFVMLLEVPPQRPMTLPHSDESVRLPAVTSPTNRRVSPKNRRSSPKNRRAMVIRTQTVRREELKRGPLSKRHMARALVRIMLRKLRSQSPGADVHGAGPLDPKRLRLMNILMQTLPAITQGLIHIQVRRASLTTYLPPSSSLTNYQCLQIGLDAGSKSTRVSGSRSTSALSLPPVRGAMPNALGQKGTRMPNPVNQLAHLLMRHNPRHTGNDKQKFFDNGEVLGRGEGRGGGVRRW